MRKIFTALLLLASFNALIGQTYKQVIYTNLAQGEIKSLNSISFGDTVITGSANIYGGIALYALNEYGYPVKVIEHSGNGAPDYALRKISSSRFSLLYRKNEDYAIAEYDKSLNLIGEISLLEVTDYPFFIAYTVNDKGNYVYCFASDTALYYKERDRNGIVLKESILQKYEQNSYRYWINRLEHIKDDEYFIWRNTYLNKLKAGALDTEFSWLGAPYIDVKADKIYTLHDGGNDQILMKYDLEGKKTGGPFKLPTYYNSLFITSDGGFVTHSSQSPGNNRNTLYKFSPYAVVSWEKSIGSNEVSGLIETEGEYIFSSQGDHNMMIMKTQKDGYMEYLNLKGINEWESENIGKIKLEYSSDRGRTWKTAGVYEGGVTKDTSIVLPRGQYTARIYGDGILRDSLIKPYMKYNEYSLLNVNNFEHIVRAVGDAPYEGYYSWPKGPENASPIFADGFVLGFKRNGVINVHGSTYGVGLAPGPVNLEGVNDAGKDFYSIFHVKKDINLEPDDSLRAIYEYDRENWPVEFGARWIDKDNDGLYDPGYDEPEFLGDEVLFSVSNTSDETATRSFYGSPAANIEIRKTVYASGEDPVKDAIFKKYQLINKTGDRLEDVYFTYWADDDLGFVSDDLVGVDTSLNMMYTYNGDNNDDGYYGTPPPAVAHMMLQGPAVNGNSSDSAYYKYEWVKGKKNLDISSSSYFDKGNVYRDVQLGQYSGTLEMYNLMQGLLYNGEDVINPLTNEPAKFAVPGDPVSGEGWYDGPGWPGGIGPSDRRIMITAGPFNMEPGDTQEAVYAIFMAKGEDNLNSITELRESARKIQEYYFSYESAGLESRPAKPEKYVLHQNYPNPFNASTTIRFELPRQEAVSLKIYDILGREVYSLNGQIYPAGRIEIKITTSGLASGVYFYRIEAGKFNQIKKMVLLK